MRTIILCGGRGTRLDSHGTELPKGLFRIGNEPIIWHICKLYSHFGLRDFTLCLGFLSDEFAKYFGQPIGPQDAASGANESRGPIAMENNWHVDLIDTGVETNTGGRLKRLERHLENDHTFCVTYGDGLADLDLTKLIKFHRGHGKTATLTAVNPVSPFGLLDLDEKNVVERFREKPVLDIWINGGFFVFNRNIFDYLDTDSVLEEEPFERLSANGQLMAYRHPGFWKCMDTFKDNIELNELWNSSAPWKLW